jgi:alkanesulfonate monooxygenase SsuD/methylene tetrahydromethanopterin reductase-like flavin-dependent oxidoreductase (luciferase family)
MTMRPWNFNVEELQLYFSEGKKGEYAQSGEGLDIPIWILGSSTESAYLAAAKGLPYVLRVILLRHNSQCNIINNFQPSRAVKRALCRCCSM